MSDIIFIRRGFNQIIKLIYRQLIFTAYESLLVVNRKKLKTNEH